MSLQNVPYSTCWLSLPLLTTSCVLSVVEGKKVSMFFCFFLNDSQFQLLSHYTLVPWMCCERACSLMLVTALKETAPGDLRLILSTTGYNTNAKGVQKLFSHKCGDLNSSVFCLGAIFALPSHYVSCWRKTRLLFPQDSNDNLRYSGYLPDPTVLSLDFPRGGHTAATAEPPRQVSVSALMGDSSTDLLFRNNSINNLSFVMGLEGDKKWRGGGV